MKKLLFGIWIFALIASVSLSLVITGCTESSDQADRYPYLINSFEFDFPLKCKSAGHSNSGIYGNKCIPADGSSGVEATLVVFTNGFIVKLPIQ